MVGGESCFSSHVCQPFSKYGLAHHLNCISLVLQGSLALLTLYRPSTVGKEHGPICESVIVQMAESGDKSQDTGHRASTSASETHPDDKVEDSEMTGGGRATQPHPQLTKSSRPNLNTMQQFQSIFTKQYRPCVILAIGIPVFCQMSGVNVLVSYSTKLFEDAGMDAAIVGTTIFGLANIIGSFISICTYEKFGRIKTTSVSVTILILCCLFIALIDLASSTVSGIVSTVCVTVFIMAFASSCGPMNHTYAAEVVPPEIASVVLGLGQSLSLIVNLILVLVFPGILDAIGVLLSFLFFCVVCVCFLFFLKLYMIETKGKDPEEIWKESTKC